MSVFFGPRLKHDCMSITRLFLLKACQIPNKLMLSFRGGQMGCFTVLFSHAGTILAAACADRDTFPVVGKQHLICVKLPLLMFLCDTSAEIYSSLTHCLFTVVMNGSQDDIRRRHQAHTKKYINELRKKKLLLYCFSVWDSLWQSSGCLSWPSENHLRSLLVQRRSETFVCLLWWHCQVSFCLLYLKRKVASVWLPFCHCWWMNCCFVQHLSGEQVLLVIKGSLCLYVSSDTACLGLSGDTLTQKNYLKNIPRCTKECLHYSVVIAVVPQGVECGEASHNSTEGASSSVLCVLCSVPPHRPEPGGERRLWLGDTSVEAWCRWRERPAAAGVWGSQQFHQHNLFWLWRWELYLLLMLLPSVIKQTVDRCL